MGKPINKNLLKFAIMCVAIQDIGAGATSPALHTIAAAFPNVNIAVIDMLSSLPQLFLVIFSIIYAKLTQFVPKRTLLKIAAVGFLVGGIAPAFLDSLWVILAFRALLGAACGILWPMGNELAVDFFEGDERQSMLGWVFSMASLGVIMFQTAGGYLAGINWHYTFYAYAISIIILIVPLVFLPEPEKKASDYKAATILDKGKERVPASVYINAFMMFLWILFWFTLITNTADIIIEGHLGSPAVVGLALSLATFGAFCASSVFGKMVKTFKGKSFTVLPFAFNVIGLGILYFASSMTMIWIAMFISGLAMGTANPAFINKATLLAHRSVAPFAIAIAVAAGGLGQFLQPIVFAPILAAAHQGPGKYSVLVGCIASAVCMVIMFFVDKSTPVRQVNGNEPGTVIGH